MNATVSEFGIIDHGGGRYQLTGEVTFATAERILRDSSQMFARQQGIEIDLSDVVKTDSAGLALLLEWLRIANDSGAAIRFQNIPEKVRAIAQTAEVEALLERDQSSSSSTSISSSSKK